MTASASLVDEVKDVLVHTLGVEDRASTMDASTELFGSLPELDSLAVLELVAALESRFDVVVDDEDLDGEVFDTLGSLTAFVERKLTST